MRKIMKNVVLITASLPLLVACGSGSARDSLGLRRSSPDEFKVISNQPLSVPPDFALRPPVEGSAKALASTQSDSSILFDKNGKAAAKKETGKSC